jgi:murein DD-endopeptidase MepM/ murein hydrolase activator NlpD
MEGVASDGLNWCLVRLANKTEGYIYRDLLSNIDSIGERKYKKSERRMGKQLVVISTILSIHETGDIESKIIGSLNRGDIVQKIEGFEETILDGRAGSWIRIQTEKDSGFVFDADVKEVEVKPIVKEKSEFKIGEIWYVKADRLNLREEPNQTSSVLTSLINSDEVRILEVSKKETIGNIKLNWVKVESKKNEIKGWVFAGFLSKEKSVFVINDEIGKPFQFPLSSNKNISSAYGPRINPITKKAGNFHTGIDIVAKVGTPIQAASDGEVSEIFDYGKRGYGRLMIVSHANDFFTYYAHQSKFEAQKKDKVKAGQIIGYVGNTGASTGPHLHFEVRKGREHYDPKKFVPME